MAIMHTSTGNSDPREPRPRRSFRRPLLIAPGSVAVVIVFPILLGAFVFAFLLNSSRGHAYLIDLIQKQARESLGVRVRPPESRSASRHA